MMPFSWAGVRLGRLGVSRLRVRLVSIGDSALRLDAVDECGDAVVSVRSFAVRPVDPAQFEGARRAGSSSLFTVGWAPAAAPDGAGPARIALLGADVAGSGERYPDLEVLERALAEGAPVPDVVLTAIGSAAADHASTPAAAAHAVAARTLGLLQRWLASEPLASARLVLVTRHAVAVGDQEPQAPD